MKFLAAALAVAVSALPLMANAAVFTFYAYGEEGCGGVALNEIQVDGQGAHSGYFGGPRRSFKIYSTDFDCELIVWTGDFTGTKTVFFKDFPPDGTCAGDSLSYQTYDVHCY